MLNFVLIALCLGYMGYLSHRWVGLTVDMQEINRQRRLSRHLNWQPVEMPKPKRRKRGLTRR